MKFTTKQNNPEILDLIKGLNSHSDKIKIRARAKYSTKGEKKLIGYTIFFDYYSKGNRQLEYLDKSLHLDGLKSSLPEDKEKLRLIEALRNKKQLDLIERKTGFNLKEFQNKNFITYFEKYNNGFVYNSALLQLKKYLGSKILTFENLDRALCEGFANFLIDNFKPNTAEAYYRKFKGIINKAMKEDIIQRNPALYVIMKKEDTKREFLTMEELRILSKIKKPNIDTCNAFLFSCFSGLRYSDIKKLKFTDIKEGYIEFRQKKTGQYERIKLSSSASKIIEKQKEFIRNDYIFNLTTPGNIITHLNKWTASAGINKHISFHCGRHTFATLSLTNDIDIFTVSKLLGHRDLKTTQIYAKLIDKKKDQAIDKLPEIDI